MSLRFGTLASLFRTRSSAWTTLNSELYDVRVQTNYMLRNVGNIFASFTIINGKIIILCIDASFRSGTQIEVNKLQKFITSVAFYITKAKQTIIAVNSVARFTRPIHRLVRLSSNSRERERVVCMEEEHRGAIGVREGKPATINNGTRHAAIIRLRPVDTSRASGLPPFKIIIVR